MAGRLAVTIIEAKALDNEDSISLNDPYIEVYIDDDYKQRTATISNSRTPRWDETFEL
jgi:Ca2+-dependent lipid-binding protein